MTWNALIDDQAVRSLLHKDYAHFARPIREALIIFLSGLPNAAQHAILVEQAELPSTTGTSERLARLARQCPVLHKLGQALARDQRLDPALRRELRKLEAFPSAVPLATLRQTLERELGSLDHLGIKLDSKAIAEASVAVVIGYQDKERGGVFKVLKPDVEERLELELELLGQLGRYLDERCTELGIPKLRYEEAFRHIRVKLRDEVRFAVEQRNLVLAAEQYAARERVLVPALHGYCTARVTAMERISGRKVTKHGLKTLQDRSRLASLLASALLAHPVFSTRDDALFHGDPHAGNLLVTPEGRLAILDWSLAGTLTQKDREAIMHILVGAMMLNEHRVAEMLALLAQGNAPDRALLLAVVRRWLRRLRHDPIPDLGWVVGLLDDAVERADLRARSALLLFRKALHTLHGVITDVAQNDRSIDHTLAVEFLQHFATEWPRRWLTASDSRSFATRLSNMDLGRLALSYPFAVARFWINWTWAPDSRTPLSGDRPDRSR